MLKKRKNKKDIPEKPGVYLFKAGDKILYIGKAKNLKKRVTQYFQGRDHLIIDNLLSKADDLEFIVTESEIDALQLEYNLIHTYQPPFNVRLKDDKSFPYIEITLEDQFPGIYFSRQSSLNRKNFYAGPITNAGRARALIDMVTRVFKLRVCTPSVFNRKAGCLYYYIDRCTAPCMDKITAPAYAADVKDAVSLLKGKRDNVIKRLRRKMGEMADDMQFEAAQAVKEDIDLLKEFSLDSYITTLRRVDYDVLAMHLDNRSNDCFIVLFSVLEGRVKRKEFFNFSAINGEPEEVLSDFLVSFYSDKSIPPELVVRFYPADRESLEGLFSGVAGRKVRFRVPARGDKKKMSDLAARNLNVYVQKTNYSVIGGRLKSALKLKRFPLWIEGFDISHFSERERVGAMVAFTKGQPDRKKYRSYIIKEAAAGDTEALKEVLERRFRKTEEYPDLLLIDGGKGQLSAALEVKNKLKIPSDVISLAKEEERIYLEAGGSVVFPDDSPERFLMQNVRDEVHRRAITHHRKRRQKLP